MLLFSATFEDSVWQFAERIIPDPNVIKLRKEELTLNNIRQYYVLCGDRKDKYQALCNIYGGITIGQAIIFCQVTAEMRLRHAQASLQPEVGGQYDSEVPCSQAPCSALCTLHHLLFRATLSRNYL